jgi:hypothetical protein
VGERHDIDMAHYLLVQREMDELRAELARMAALFEKCIDSDTGPSRDIWTEANAMIDKWLPEDKLRNVGLPKEVRDE